MVDYNFVGYCGFHFLSRVSILEHSLARKPSFVCAVNATYSSSKAYSRIRHMNRVTDLTRTSFLKTTGTAVADTQSPKQLFLNAL